MSKRYRSKIIESVSDFVDEVCSVDFADTALFRGQREDWPLVPKIARLNFLLD